MVYCRRGTMAQQASLCRDTNLKDAPKLADGQSWTKMVSFKWALMLPALVAVASSSSASCKGKGRVSARTDAGWVCGAKRIADDGVEYASFRGVPYGQPPLGELRFKELQPVTPWSGFYNATEEGPVCPYHYVFYGPLMQPRAISEDCIYANIHTPITSLPDGNKERPQRKGLPIIVYIHGGGWIDGSGDADFNGPERLVSKGVVVITFNYRLGAFGFLTLNTAKVPGNAGLRDMRTLLQWVQRNAASFGGDPRRVTLAGQSAGAASAHLLSLSPATNGLFDRLWLMSGTALPSFYTTTPAYAEVITNSFLTLLGLNGTDYDAVHEQLVQMPLEAITNASTTLLSAYGITTFVPVIEMPFPNVTRMVEDDPETLLANGVGSHIPMVVGFTNVECETSRLRLQAINILERYAASPLIGVAPHFLFTRPPSATAAMAEAVRGRYFGEAAPTLDAFVRLCSETYFAYPALRLARLRAAGGGAPVYLYKYAYDAERSVFKQTFNLTYTGAGHSEDMVALFKVNSVPLPPSDRDDDMSDWLTDFLVNFMRYGTPVPCEDQYSWPAQRPGRLRYQNILTPRLRYVKASHEDRNLVRFFDTLSNV